MAIRDLHQTHTNVEMEVSPETFAEIQQRFKIAGYGHVFGRDGDKLKMDMNGVVLTTSEKVLNKKIVEHVFKPLARRNRK